MKNRPLFLSVIGAFVFAATGVGESLLPSNDAYIRNSEPPSGEIGQELVVAGRQAAFLRKSYLEFDLSSLPAPYKSLKLVLTPIRQVKSKKDDLHSEVSVAVYCFLSKDSAWSEKDIRWDNAPGNDEGVEIKSPAQLVVETVLPFDPNKDLTDQKAVIDLAPILPAVNKAVQDGDQHLTLILAPLGVNITQPGIMFMSKEGTSLEDRKPHLEVE